MEKNPLKISLKISVLLIVINSRLDRSEDNNNHTNDSHLTVHCVA